MTERSLPLATRTAYIESAQAVALRARRNGEKVRWVLRQCGEGPLLCVRYELFADTKCCSNACGLRYARSEARKNKKAAAAQAAIDAKAKESQPSQTMQGPDTDYAPPDVHSSGQESVSYAYHANHANDFTGFQHQEQDHRIALDPQLQQSNGQEVQHW